MVQQASRQGDRSPRTEMQTCHIVMPSAICRSEDCSESIAEEHGDITQQWELLSWHKDVPNANKTSAFQLRGSWQGLW